MYGILYRYVWGYGIRGYVNVKDTYLIPIPNVNDVTDI
jgi:hypothetical protein